MKISLNWLNDHVDLSGLDPEEVSLRLTMGSAEVEEVEELHRAVEGAVVGEVTAAEELHAEGEGKKLHLCKVACGEQTFQTVCGAPNVKVGMKAAFAPPGATLADGTTLEALELGGHRSEGVLCSPRELGLSEFHEVLLECPPDLAPGAALSELIPARDIIIEIENKSLTHRPDLWGHYGFARELAALYGRELRPLGAVDLAAFDELPAYAVSIDDLVGCPAYSCLELAAPGALPAPLEMQARLHGLGQRSMNLLVDLTNYVMMELGQPTHAFDGDKLRAVRVAQMGEAGVFTTLDGQERKMLAEDLMIWNEQEPVAIAGVMGGLDTEVTPATKTLLLESANFKGAAIRRTAVRLGLRSEASLRFEKNQPPVNVKRATSRFLHLMEAAGFSPRVSSRFSVEGDLKEGMRPLQVKRSFIEMKAGEDLPRETVDGILRSLEFTVADGDDPDIMELGVPSHRSVADVSIPEDIVEEVLRVYGYDNIKPRMPETPTEPVWINEDLGREHKARRLLSQAHGFTEVHSYSWFDDPWLETLGFEPVNTLTLRNPSAQQMARMRTTIVPNLLAMVRPNRAHRESFRLYELGRAYLQNKDGRDEYARLCGVSYSQARELGLEEHLRQIRGVVEDLLGALGCDDVAFSPAEGSPTPWQQEGHWLALTRGGKQVGALGVLAGETLEAVTRQGQVVWFELAIQALNGPLFPDVSHKDTSPYPGSWHDFSLVWETARGYAALEEMLDKYNNTLVTSRELLYLYKLKGADKGKGSYTFRYWLGAQDHTLSGEEIEGFRQGFLAHLEKNGISLR